MRPQESSNRTDTYDLYLCDSHGEGFRVQAYYETPFAFSAYHYTLRGWTRLRISTRFPMIRP